MICGNAADSCCRSWPGVAGMIIPIGIYLLINQGRMSVHGWGVAMSTDTALALGVLAVLGRDIPDRMRVFVLTVFVVDDLAALGVIAVAYSDRVTMIPLVVAAAAFALLLLAVRLRLERRMVFVGLGILMWGALRASGVDPIVAGLAIGLAAPAYTPARDELQAATGLVRRVPRTADARTGQVGPSRPQLDAVAKRAAADPLPPVDQLPDRPGVCAG